MNNCLRSVAAVETYGGITITRAATDAVALQQLTTDGGTIVLLFNDVVLRIRDGSTVDEVCEEYDRKLSAQRR